MSESIKQVSPKAESKKERIVKKLWSLKFQILGVVVLIVIMLVVLARNGTFGDGMANWTSSDYKLLNKSHTGQTRRSDNKNDNWSRKDMIESVSRFNRIAAE